MNGFEEPRWYLYAETDAGQWWLDRDTEIVRCRDCKHFNEYHGKCHRQSGVLIDDYSTRRLEDLGDVLVLVDAEPDGFCAWGERRGDAE